MLLDANARRLTKEAELNAHNHGVPVAKSEQNRHRLLSAAVADYLDEIRLTKKPKTHMAYTTALSYFTESCAKRYLEDIERRDLLAYSAFLRDKKQLTARTCWNKFSTVMSFLKARKIRGLAKKNDWPRFTEEEPEMYEEAELEKLFNACDAEERLS
jgi:site-specific recombinase XerD